MNKKIALIIDKLLSQSHNSVTLKALEKLFNTGIPFTLPHKFKFIEMSDKYTRLRLPDIRKNRNHLGGLHACAIATLGEYVAGLSLIKHVGSSKYRLVMRKIEVNYFKQAKESLIGVYEVDHEELKRVEIELSSGDKTEIHMAANILNKKEEVIAVVETTWQLKNWTKVRYKG